MTYLNTRQKELFREFANMADKVCNLFYDCKDCPFSEYPICPCVAIHEKEPSRLDDEPKCADGCIYGWNSLECKTCDYKDEDLPIDLDDDNHCDECYKPVFNECLTDKYNDDCPYGLGECCDDNLATNVGRICFDHNIPTNFAMAIIEIIQKERDRNEYLRMFGKRFEQDTDFYG